MTHLLDGIPETLFGLLRGRQPDAEMSPECAAAIDQAIEAVVNGTDSSIRRVGNYKARLKDAVFRSCEYVDELMDRVPGPLTVSRETFATDPRVNTLFVNVEHLQTVFSRSPELRHFFEDINNHELNESHALLCMKRTEKTVLGMDMMGNTLRKDVPQVSVAFSDHQIISPAATESAARQGLKKCLFDGLVANVLEHLVGLRSAVQRLRLQRGMTQTRLNALRAEHGETPAAASGQAEIEQAEIESVIRELDRIEQELKQANARLDTPDDYLSQVTEVLANPESYVQVRDITLRLNRMGVKVGEQSTQTAAAIELAEAAIGNDPPRVVVLARYARNELLPKEDFLERAQRHLLI